jgi:hypothetical protein
MLDACHRMSESDHAACGDSGGGSGTARHTRGRLTRAAAPPPPPLPPSLLSAAAAHGASSGISLARSAPRKGLPPARSIRGGAGDGRLGRSSVRQLRDRSTFRDSSRSMRLLTGRSTTRQRQTCGSHKTGGRSCAIGNVHLMTAARSVGGGGGSLRARPNVVHERSIRVTALPAAASSHTKKM